MIARDEWISILRREMWRKRIWMPHDITIPYEELELLEAVKENGETIPIIADGRFVLEGTEELNKPLKMLCKTTDVKSVLGNTAQKQRKMEIRLTMERRISKINSQE